MPSADGSLMKSNRKRPLVVLSLGATPWVLQYSQLASRQSGSITVRRKRLRHKENVRRVGTRPELVPSVLCTCAPARLLEDAVASKDRYFLFILFFAVFLESMESTVGYRMAWLAGVQALRSAIEWRSGPSQTAWAAGSVG